MRKIGVIFCAFNVEEYVRDSIRSWIELKTQYNISIAAISVPFAEYISENIPDDKTTEILRKEYLDLNKINYLIDTPRYIKEYEARDLAAQSLLKEDCDHIVLWDGDEIATSEQLINIINYVETNTWYSWFAFSYKNFIFDRNTFLDRPFTPPRWFRVYTNGYTFQKIYFDNDALYQGTVNKLNSFQNKAISYKDLPSKIIPTRVAWIPHYTWLNDERSRRKVEYQKKHFGHCSFRWDSEKKSLFFDSEYFKKTGEPIPEVIHIF